MSKEKSKQRPNQKKLKWLSGVDVWGMRRCLIAALGSHVRLGRKAKVGWEPALAS